MNLISKYNIAAPRYTSYPTVPYWQQSPSQEQWKELVYASFVKTNHVNGISLYIHLPYCESLCTYCACNTRITVNHAVEEPYIDSVLKEWELYLHVFDDKPVIKEIHLGGGTPTFFSAKNLKRLLDGILKDAEKAKGYEFSFEAHPNNTSAEHLQTLFDCGFKRVSFGIQDFDPVVQDAINRMQSFEQVAKVVGEAREIGYNSINFDLVYGLPFQTLQSVKDTIRLVNQLRPDRIAFYSYAHVPWLKPGQRKFTEKDLPADHVKRALYEAGLEAFKNEGYIDIGMDHFALPGDSLHKASAQHSLHRNFMGYTHHYTELMVSLGVSSISDTWNAFAQNLKTVEDYREAVEKRQFPVFKGHVLSASDQVLRRHILNIMCKGYTSWEDETDQCEELEQAIARTEELQQDGLVELEGQTLKVSETGKAFLRNICLCFDARYWAKTPEAKIFSSVV